METVVLMNRTEKSFGKFLILWSGELVSAIGSGLTSFGLGVWVFQQTGRASAMALVILLGFMPSLLLSAVSGVLADRYDRRLLMVLGDSLSASGLVFILICMHFGQLGLWQICVGVTISSVFSSLLEPAYKATITDLLTKEQYTRASGLVQVAGSAKYLISPVIAGFLLIAADIQLLLLIDISTFVLTVISTLFVRSGLISKKVEQKKSFLGDFKEGWAALSDNRGVLILVILTSAITFFLGFIQVLSKPLILSFSKTSILGMVETISASGMLVTSVILGIISIKKDYVTMLSVSMFCAGLFMSLYGLRENIVLICISGFLFFSMLPFANTSLDYLIRTNMDNSVQGRAWGLIGVISQLGYVAAYALSGLLADYWASPLLFDGGLLAGSLGKIFGTGSGRGIGFLISISGVLLSGTSIILYNVKSIKKLENRGELCFTK